MATPIGSLYASLTMDVGQYAQGWALADRITARGASNIRKEAGLAQASVARFAKTSASSGIKPYGLIAVSRAFERVNDRVGLLRGTMLATTAVFGGLTAALSSNLVLRYADTYTNLTNQIRVVSDDALDLAGQLSAVAAAADNSRGSLQATAVLYSRLAKAAPSKSNSDVLEYVQTIQRALALGGATAQESASAAVQFSQAIASNRLGGEELRAVLETPLGLALAKGLDVTIGKLREMSIAGELTADKVLGALSRIKGDIDEQFSKSILTIDQSLVKADNRLTEYIGTLDKTYGLTRLVSGGILSFADNIDKVAGSAATLGLALGSAFAGRLVGRGASKAVDSTFGTVKRRAAEARDQVEKLTKAQHDLSQELDRGTRAFGSLQKRDNVEFASKSDLKVLQREEAKLNRIREDRLATTTRLRDAVAAAGAVEVKSTKQTIASAGKIVETQGKIEDSLARQTTLTNELQKAETRLTAAKGQQTLNVANIGAVKEAEKDIIRIRQQQIAETAKTVQLEDSVGAQRIALADKIGDAEAKAAEQRAKFQSIAQAASKQTAKLQVEEFEQTQRLGRARAGIGELGAIGKTAEINNAQAALGGLRTSLDDTSVALSSAVRGTSVLRQSFGLLKGAGASLVGFLGGPWGFAFTGAIAVMALLGVRSARTAAEIENTKKAVAEDLAEIAKTPGKVGEAAESSTKRDQLQGELDAAVEKIRLYRKSIASEGKLLEEAVREAFQPFVDLQISKREGFTAVLDGALAKVSEIVRQVQAGDLAASQIGESVKAIPEFKFANDDLVPDIIRAASEMAKFGSVLDLNEKRARELGISLQSSTGDIDAADKASRAYAHLGQSIVDSEAALDRSSKLVKTLIADTKGLARETELESSIRKATTEILKDNKDLTTTHARELAIVNTALETIKMSSAEWLRSTEATSGEFGRLLALAKQIAPAIDFSKQNLNSTQLSAITDMLAKQTDLAKREAERTVIGDRQRAILQEQDSILDGIMQKYGTIEGVDMSQVKASAEALVDFDRGADAINRADEAIRSLSTDTSNLGVVAQTAVNNYVVGLNGAVGSLAAFRNSQIDIVNQIVAVGEQTKDVSSSLSAYQGELQRLIATSAQSLFGGLENTAGVRSEIAAVSQGIVGLASRFANGKLSAHDLSAGMAEIEARLKALGANNDALGPFIRSVLSAIAKIAQLIGALDLLKRISGTLGGGSTRAGLTGTRTVDPATGIGVSRFGGSGGGGAEGGGGQVVRSIENGVGVTRFGQDQTTAATNAVGTGISTLDTNVSDGLSTLNSSVVSSGQAINTSIANYSEVMKALFAQGYSLANINTKMGSNIDTTHGSGSDHMFGDAINPETGGSYISSWGIRKIKKGTYSIGPQDYDKGPGKMGNITVGDINVNGVSDGAEAGRQAAYEFVRTVYGAMSGRV